jgi:hypothetical protein
MSAACLASVRHLWCCARCAAPSLASAHAVPHRSGPLARSLTHTPARSCTRSCCTQALSTHAHAHVHAAAAHVAAVRKHVRRGQPGGRFDRSCTAANQSGQPEALRRIDCGCGLAVRCTSCSTGSARRTSRGCSSSTHHGRHSPGASLLRSQLHTALPCGLCRPAARPARTHAPVGRSGSAPAVVGGLTANGVGSASGRVFSG